MERNLDRRLVAIMFTDMVGYTAIMQENEELGIRKRNRHREVLRQYHDKYGGEIIQYFGDGTLSIFNNSNDAIDCGIEIQKALKVPIDVPLRIGIHVGNVIIEKDGILGDAVNIASRIESFANIGGVLISDAVHDQVKNQVQYGFIPMGKFTLKNVIRPFEIFAVSAKGIVVPDAYSLQGKGGKIAIFKTDIPVPVTPILGRDLEAENLLQLLADNRVVTITGTGGMGKTRLSLEVCRRLEPEFKDGIAFISMATLTEAKEVMPTLATAIDIKEAEGRSLLEGVAALISDKKAMIVLDNLEHVLSAAIEIAELVESCQNLTILCTSRAPLKIKAEKEYLLNPFSIPKSMDIESLMNYPAIELFVTRAQKVRSDFELKEENSESILEICRRMDGLPLALELAAARIRILSPEKLLHRLNRALDLLTSGSKDLPERQQTLRATIDWSHDLLNDPEQKLFRRLGVFTGGFTLEAIEEVCYLGEDSQHLALDELESLLDNGLVKNIDNGRRFSLLQTIKDFAEERLKDKNESEKFYKRHIEYYFEITKKIESEIQKVNQLEWMKNAATEEANIQSALDRLMSFAQKDDEKASEMGLNICGDLWMYWHIRGKHQTAKKYINSFLSANKNLEASIGKCKALFHLHVATFSLAEIEECQVAASRLFEMAAVLQDQMAIAKSYFAMGWAQFFTDLKSAVRFSEVGLDRFRKLNNDSWLGFSLWQNGLMKIIAGDLKMAKEYYFESLSIFTNTKNNEGMGCALSGLAMIEFIETNHEGAIDKYQKALTSFHAVGDRPEEARILSEMSWTYLANKNTIAARKCALESIHAYQEVGSPRGIGLSLNGLAAIEAVESRPKRAIGIATAAEHYAEQQGVVIEFGMNNHGTVYLEKAKNSLAETEIINAQNEGRMLTLQEVLEMPENDVILIS